MNTLLIQQGGARPYMLTTSLNTILNTTFLTLKMITTFFNADLE